MKVGLYFGTYNPIHVGHLIIANYMADYTALDEVWLIVSPQNPLKQKSSLLADYHRYAMVEIAVQDNPKLKPSNIEFKLPQPSYTINTLTYLKEKHPKHEFSLIMGEDNLRTLNKWKNYEEIIQNHKIYVYPRALTEQEQIDTLSTKKVGKTNSTNIVICDAPVMRVSASFIRNAIKQKKDVRYLLTEPVYKYVQEMNFYKK
ncbi:MAG: nicotinate-nucleotide adenylyltransferase [Flavobacteriales bacterium]|nr:nicotinate-nucleotide adenylyltransferase [Flavobacteriales bacterium]MCB9174584.1 nicotinate-nucleotide adenylyltransferase [Flavobacteriales bacterium]